MCSDCEAYGLKKHGLASVCSLGTFLMSMYPYSIDMLL